jgi:PAS domain S-box-containing protein
MGEPLRILLVQHQAAHAQQICAELERGGFELTPRHVQSDAEIAAALEEQTWDAVIAESDSTTATQALASLLDPDLPLIVVPSAAAEDTAAELIRAGAHEVVTLSNLRRLVPAVEHERREAGRHRQHRLADQALRESEERYRVLVESSPEPIAVHSQGVIVYANPAAARLMGAADPAQLLGLPVLGFVHPDDRPVVLDRIRQTQTQGLLAAPVEERFVRLDGGVIHVETTALPTVYDGRSATQVVVRDITAHKRATASQRFLAESSARLASSLEYRDTLQTVAQLAVPDLGEYCLVDLLASDGAFERVAVAAAVGQPEPRQANVREATERVAAKRTTEVVGDASEGLRSYVCTPLIARGRLLGAITFGSVYPRRYDAETVVVAEDLASRSAMAIDNANLFEQARASRDQLEAILGGIADGVLVQERNGQFVYANDAAAKVAGFSSTEQYLHATASEISGRLEVVDADGQPFDYSELPASRALRGEASPEMVVQFRRRDSWERRWSLTRSRVVQGADGQPLAISIFHDLTDRIQSEQRQAFLAEAGAQLGMSLDERATLEAITQLAVQQMADWSVVYVPDEDGTQLLRTAFAHKASTRMDLIRELEERYPPKQADDSVLWRVVQRGAPVLVRDLSDATLVDVAEDPEHLRILRELQLVSGLYVPLQAGARTLGVLALFTTAESGRRLGPDDLAVTQEIARRLALAVENARLYAQTRQAIRARDEFLSLASHELRNPVAAISGTAQLIQRARQRDRLDAATIERYMEVIERTAAHLASLTEDLLDVGRLQQGRLPLRFRDMNLADLVRGVVARQASRSEASPVALQLACDPCYIVADADRLEQVVTNLLENAFKYSPHEGTIEMELSGDDAGVSLAVRDYGIGFPAAAAERIFEPFGRAANATERNIPGMGLGLYISRQIVERHGGRLWAESLGEARGTTFHVWLPRAGGAEGA